MKIIGKRNIFQKRPGTRRSNFLCVAAFLGMCRAQLPQLVAQEPSRAVITDPCLGAHWRLVADVSHPERPGRWQLVAIPLMGIADGGIQLQAQKHLTLVPPVRGNVSSGKAVIIHAGDKVIITQRTDAVNARFAAIALQAARSGERFEARPLALREWTDGVVLFAKASGPGNAIWIGSKVAAY